MRADLDCWSENQSPPTALAPTPSAAIFAKDPRPTQLSQLIRALHRNGIDPATVDPDFVTISQELRTKLTTSAPDP